MVCERPLQLKGRRLRATPGSLGFRGPGAREDALKRGRRGCCGGTASDSQHFEAMAETVFGWYLQWNRIIRGFLGCETDFVHPQVRQLGALFNPFLGWEGSPTKIDKKKWGSLIPTSLLEDLVKVDSYLQKHFSGNSSREKLPVFQPSYGQRSNEQLQGSLPINLSTFMMVQENNMLGPPVVPFHTCFGEGSPTKIDKKEKNGYPYSILFTGGSSMEPKKVSPSTSRRLFSSLRNHVNLRGGKGQLKNGP